jgi:hypothetical protein
VALAACGGSNAVPCTTGQSIACTGIAGCSGYQVCKTDGTYDACNCGNGSDAGSDVDLLADTGKDVAQTDATNDAQESGNDSGTWTSPASFSGLSLWLETSVGVVQDAQKPGYVRRWLDQSSNANNADVENYTLCEPTIDPSVLNGHDAILMASSSCDFRVPTATSLEFGAADFLIGCVVKVPSYSTNELTLTLWSKTNNGDPGLVIYQDTSNNLTMNIVGTKVVVANPDTSKFHVVIAQGAALKLFVDGLSGSGVTNTTDISAATWGINMLTGANNGVAGYEVAEIVAVKGTVSSADVTNLQNYWKQKFKL